MTPAKRQPAPPFHVSLPAKRRWLLALAAVLEIVWIAALLMLAMK